MRINTGATAHVSHRGVELMPLADFNPESWGALPADDFVKFSHFRFDEQAQEIFIEWSIDLHKKRIPIEENQLIVQHLAKFDKLFPALALLFHLIDCAHSGTRGMVGKDAALRAAAWCEYLESHARRCYGLLADEGLRAAQALAVKVSGRYLVDGFTARDVRRPQWRNLTTEEGVNAALEWLDDEGWIRGGDVATPGRPQKPTRRYAINPKTQKRGGVE